jgi:hypothetical protein
VNYTIPGEHAMDEGFVLGYGERNTDGTITLRHYEEGNAGLMSLGPLPRAFWLPGVTEAWGDVQREIVNDVRRRH